MDIFIGPGTYAGDPYLPDEIAKQLVKEYQLRDGDTVSKNTIVEYLMKHGYGPGWAVDVAMVLRNMFGVTPIFYESNDLINELKLVVEGKETVIEEDVTDNDIKMAFAIAIQQEFAEATTEDEEAVVAALSMESLETISEIAVASQYFSEDQMLQIESAYDAGGKALVEAWCDTLFRPHMVRFMESSVREQLESVIGMPLNSLVEAQATAEKQRRKAMFNAELHKRAAADVGATDMNSRIQKRDEIQKRVDTAKKNVDKLGQRADQSAGSMYRADKEAARVDNLMGRQSTPNRGREAFRNDLKSQGAMNFPKDPAKPEAPKPAAPPQPGMLRRAAGAIGRVGQGIKNMFSAKPQSTDGAKPAAPAAVASGPNPAAGGAPSAAPATGAPVMAKTPAATAPAPAQAADPAAATGKPSLGSRIGKGAMGLVKRVGKGIVGGALSGAAGLATGVAGGLGHMAKGAAYGMKQNGIAGALGGAALGAIKGAGHAAASTVGHAALGAGAGMAGSSNMGSVLKAKLRNKMPGLAYALHGAPDEHELRAAHHMGLTGQQQQQQQLPAAQASDQASAKPPRPKKDKVRNPQPKAGYQGPDTVPVK